MGINWKYARNTEPVKNPVIAKVPVIMQLEALECGAACLDMILAYYGKWIPLEKVRKDCGVSRDGSNANHIRLAAINYGMNADGYKVEASYFREDGIFPCILFWNNNHFVVLDGFHKGKAVLNDPARGTVEISYEEFESSFSGIVIELSPGENFVPEGKPKSIMGFVRKKMAGMLPAFLFAVLMSAVTALANMISPAFQRVFLDRLLSGENPEWAWPFLILVSIMTVIMMVRAVVERIFSLRLEGKVAITGNSEYMWHVLRLPVDFFSQRQTGDLAMRKQTNASIASSLINIFTPMFLNVVMIVFYFVVMVRYSLLLSVVGITSLFLNSVLQQHVSNRKINVSRVMLRDAAKLQSATVSGIEMIETIKASGVEDEYFSRWAGYQASVNRQKMTSERITKYAGIALDFISQLSNHLVLLIGLMSTISGNFTVGMLMGFQSLLINFSSPVVQMTASRDMIREMRTDMERIEDVLEYPTDVDPSRIRLRDDVSYSKLGGRVEMRNVTFGYSPLGRPLLQNFNLVVEPGKKVAFVGASGCGKSTIAKLLTGLYDPWSGEILYDGMKIKDIDRNVFTGSVAKVDQEVILFEDSIANNIRMWDESIQDFEVILAARDASIHSDIIERDGGFDHILRENGKDLSGGQRQRLEIARVLAQDPTVLIMDEATSALDARTEAEVVESVHERGITCIVVAHRLSTIRDCDEIIVMDHGLVVERGTHEELYEKGGLYKTLVMSE